MKEKENKFPTPDFDKVKCIIEIKVCDNVNTIILKAPDVEGGKINCTYQEVIGALEICKQHFINDWSTSNREWHEKQKSEIK